MIRLQAQTFTSFRVPLLVTTCARKDGVSIPSLPSKLPNLFLTCIVDLEVDQIREVVWNKLSFDHLVIDSETKEIVEALITNQIAGEQSTDIIESKGNGLIILLHGVSQISYVTKSKDRDSEVLSVGLQLLEGQRRLASNDNSYPIPCMNATDECAIFRDLVQAKHIRPRALQRWRRDRCIE
jgi:hypothetical protein